MLPKRPEILEKSQSEQHSGCERISRNELHHNIKERELVYISPPELPHARAGQCSTQSRMTSRRPPSHPLTHRACAHVTPQVMLEHQMPRDSFETMLTIGPSSVNCNDSIHYDFKCQFIWSQRVSSLRYCRLSRTESVTAVTQAKAIQTAFDAIR